MRDFPAAPAIPHLEAASGPDGVDALPNAPLATVPGSPVEPDPAFVELERTKQQLLVFAREIGHVYQSERRLARRLQSLVDELETTYLSTVQTLAFAVEAKDRYTRFHLERCREYGNAVAGEIDPALAEEGVEFGFLLHDVGKIVVPESILLKPGPLMGDEISVMRTHPLIGVQIVAPLRFLTPSAISIIRNHHERYDGSGYPDGLRGRKIPLPARIFSVVDAFDAMTSDRPYRKALSVPDAVRRLREGAGIQFDPEVVEAFEPLAQTLPFSPEDLVPSLNGGVHRVEARYPA